MTPCPCGDPHPHTIATRRTYDNVRVDLDSDGTLWIGNQRTSTSGAAPVRTDAALERARKVGRLLMDNACILEAAEVTDLYRRGRALSTVPETLRELRAALDRPPVRTLVWTVLSADRDGTPTERVCSLPRMFWPGMVVFDFCGGPGSAGGRYRVFRRIPNRGGERDAAVEDTGFAFRRLAELWGYLDSCRAVFTKEIANV